MRPEIQAYMVQASVEIAKKQGFVPANENEVGCWMMNNREAIVRRAIELQWDLLDKLENNLEAKAALFTILRPCGYANRISKRSYSNRYRCPMRNPK